MRRLLLPLVLALVVLSGCSGGDDPEPRIAPSESSSAASTTAPAPSPTPAGPVEPTLPAEAAGDDGAAAEAFVRFYWEMVNYAQATGKVDGLRSLAMPSCAACAAASQKVETVYDRGGSIHGGFYATEDFKVTAKAAGDVRLFDLTATLSTAAQQVSGAGDLDGAFPPGSGRMVMTVVVSGESFKVSSWGAA